MSSVRPKIKLVFVNFWSLGHTVHFISKGNSVLEGRFARNPLCCRAAERSMENVRPGFVRAFSYFYPGNLFGGCTPGTELSGLVRRNCRGNPRSHASQVFFYAQTFAESCSKAKDLFCQSITRFSKNERNSRLQRSSLALLAKDVSVYPGFWQRPNQRRAW